MKTTIKPIATDITLNIVVAALVTQGNVRLDGMSAVSGDPNESGFVTDN